MNSIQRTFFGVGLTLAMAACSHTPVDPIVPVVVHRDTNIVANQVTFTVATASSEYSVLQRQTLHIDANVVVHRDPMAADSAVRNYVLRDSSIHWSVMSGPGSMSSDGTYTAPTKLNDAQADVQVMASPGVDPRRYEIIHILVRKPNYAPVGNGAYWVRVHTPIDSSSGLPDNSKSTRDSMVVVGNAMPGGRQATAIVRYVGSTAVDTSYVVNDRNTIYQLVTLNDQLNIAGLAPQWIKIIDPNESSWVAFDTTFSNVNTVFNSQAALLNGSISVRNTLVDNDSISVMGQYLAVQKVVSVWTVDLRVLVNGLVLPISYTRTNTEWLSDNIGSVQSTTEHVQSYSLSCQCCLRSTEQSVLAATNQTK